MKLFKLKCFMLMFLPLSFIPTAIFIYGIGKNFPSFLISFFTFIVFFVISMHFANKKTRQKRLDFIGNYKIPHIVLQKFMSENRFLSASQVEQTVQALKQFFMAYALCNDGDKKPKDGFMMPSRIADELWHHFMLDSENYEKFCKQAYGKMLHHKPGGDNGGNKQLRFMKVFPQSLKNTYNYIEKLKDYNAHNVINGIAILFAIDAYLKINDGFYYDMQTMNNIALANSASASSSTDSGGGCGGFLASDTMGSCSSGSSGGDGGGCGGGCGD